MFIAMNRFKVIKGEEGAFEELWLSRESHLDKVPGFLEFHMLRGPERDDHVLYSSHSLGDQAALFRLDDIRAFSRGPSRHGANKADVCRSPRIRGFRSDPDG